MKDVLVKAEKGSITEQGDAAYFLSQYYRSGDEKDLKKSQVWLMQAARLANPNAITILGFNKPYVAVTELECGEYKIKISTYCNQVLVDGPVKAYCQAQDIQFFSGDQVRKYHWATHFNWRNPEGNQECVYTKAEFATCIQSLQDDQSWLEVQSIGTSAGYMHAYRYDVYNGMNYVGSDNKLQREVWGKTYKQVPNYILKKLGSIITTHSAVRRAHGDASLTSVDYEFRISQYNSYYNKYLVNNTTVNDYPSRNDTINAYREEK